MKITDVTIDGKRDSNISLVKLTGQKILDIQGWISFEFGDPVFKVSKLIHEDGKETYFEGEHDMPYLGMTDLPELQDEFLRLCRPDYDEDSE